MLVFSLDHELQVTVLLGQLLNHVLQSLADLALVNEQSLPLSAVLLALQHEVPLAFTMACDVSLSSMARSFTVFTRSLSSADSSAGSDILSKFSSFRESCSAELCLPTRTNERNSD